MSEKGTGGLASKIFSIKCLMPVSHTVALIPKFADAVNPGSLADPADFQCQGEDGEAVEDAESPFMYGEDLVHKHCNHRLFFSLMSNNPQQQQTVIGAASVDEYDALVAVVHKVAEYDLKSKFITIYQPDKEISLETDVLLVSPSTFSKMEWESMITMDMRDTLKYSFRKLEVPPDLAHLTSSVAEDLLQTQSSIAKARGQTYLLTAAMDPDAKRASILNCLEEKGFAFCVLRDLWDSRKLCGI